MEQSVKLSEGLKTDLAAFYARIPAGEYWWHDPEYLVLCERIKKERTDA